MPRFQGYESDHKIFLNRMTADFFSHSSRDIRRPFLFLSFLDGYYLSRDRFSRLKEKARILSRVVSNIYSLLRRFILVLVEVSYFQSSFQSSFHGTPVYPCKERALDTAAALRLVKRANRPSKAFPLLRSPHSKLCVYINFSFAQLSVDKLKLQLISVVK